MTPLARELGIVAALGSDRQGQAGDGRSSPHVLDQGSRLSAVRPAGGHAVGAALGMIGFDEDDLYALRLQIRQQRPQNLTLTGQPLIASSIRRSSAVQARVFPLARNRGTPSGLRRVIASE
jgi:hypothetical protein